MMSTANLRVGVIGVGFGTIVQIPGFQAEGIEVVGVCSQRIDRAEKAAREFNIPYYFDDYKELIGRADIDAISIVTPPALHYPMAKVALEAGKHVLCEKPFALNAAEAFELYSFANKTGRTSMITHEFRWSPQRAYIQSLIDEGYLGELRLASLRLFFGPREGVRPRPATWALDASQGGGLLFALGSHYIDALRHWFGDVISVDARVWTHYPDRVDESKTPVSATADDTFLFTLDFENGGSATMHASSVSPFGGGARIDLFGTEGTLVALQPGVNPLHDGKVTGARLGGEGLEELTMPDKFRPFEDERDGRSMPFRLLVREFVVGVETGTSPNPNFYDGWKCQQILDGALESSRTGKRVPIR
jgi:predicted dehydrogenase